MLSQGHYHAESYELWRLKMEYEISVEGLNTRMVSEATILQSAVGGLLSSKENKKFQKLVKKVLENG